MPKQPLVAPSSAPTQLPTLPEQIAAHLTDAVLRGDYAPGEAILESRVAASFAVSRAPVREALRILERDGVVVVAPRKGARVTRLSRTEVTEIYDVRAHLFGLAAGRFAERCPDAVIEAMDRKLAALAAGASAGDDPAEFHSRMSAELAVLLTGACGNAKLAALVHHMARQVTRYTYLGLSTPKRRAQSIANWRGLLRAARAGDGTAAAQTARWMVEQTCAQAIAALGEDG